jgi:hypothetical protein
VLLDCFVTDDAIGVDLTVVVEAFREKGVFKRSV